MKSTKNGGRRAVAPTLTPAEALAMLASAVTYCQSAGLEVRAGNTAQGLVLHLPGARLAQREGGAEFVTAEASPAAPAELAQAIGG